MYEELQQAIRRATQIEGNVWREDPTDELVATVTRHGQTLWKGRWARIFIVKVDNGAEHIHEVHMKAGNQIVDKILDEVDWDEFYPTPETDPFETLPQMQCPRAMMAVVHERHIEERVQFGTGALVRLVCQGYPDEDYYRAQPFLSASDYGVE